MPVFRCVLVIIALLASFLPAMARTITDAAGRVVEIPDKVERVLAAGPPASVLVYVLAPDKLAGWVREPKPEEKAFLLPSVRDLPVFGQLTGKGGTANIEAVLAAKPDIIIDVGTVNPTYASLADKVQAQTGIPYVLVDGAFARSGAMLRETGAMLGVEARAETLAAYADERFAALEKGLAGIPTDKRPSVYYGRGGEGLETGLAGSINMELLEAVGARNVAAAAGKGGLTQVSLEQILSWKPDTILAASPKFAEAVKDDPLWAQLDAVKAGRVHVTPSLPFGWIDSPPGINRLVGVSWLEHTLYPETVPTALDEEVRTFFKLFYQVELSDAQLATLLGKGAAK
ncbi:MULTISPECIES: iron ABC transporter substrate-binding protein [unclassified Shinella]|uniref:iron ABC transporter substrate-binding protein n=1 Tax=unclassified Shinella TaxID=2643062 RepID=UPI00225D9453|nr:iron ABC transporter substrate-binding protein [Shinella sp. YE25]MDC7258925.1 iron ABC transporter substrate-binding protein [Shinella sp. YE25]CAI0334297.1 Iron ABC transporter substrate-binding protein [Rhizobiaceae bacterium]CAK7260481.1 iron complex transport system substrate-binding protein [Shinella sp. WSC3-e]